MALAKYFTKDLLAIKQVFSQGSREKFEQLLNSHVVEIAFDDEVSKMEVQSLLDLLVRLTSRLYPQLKFSYLGKEKGSAIISDYIKKAKSINSQIEIVDSASSFSIILGRTPAGVEGKRIYVGSDGWNAKLSTINPVGCGSSMNPFGAGVAACLASSNAFRYVFQEFIGRLEMDDEVVLDVSNLNQGTSNNDFPEIDLGVIHLVGMGAIGNGFLWAFSKMQNCQGVLKVIDDQTVSLSNLQRYVCTDELSIDKVKSAFAKEFLKANSIITEPYNMKWAGYVAKTNEGNIDMVAVAVDSAKDRIGIQSSLPHRIVNAYTENNITGITRHLNFGVTACLVCGYIPEKKMKDYSQEVADNLGIPNLENQVRHYIAYDYPVDDNLLMWISQGNGIGIEDLSKFRGQRFSNFYSDAVCGGVLLSLTGATQNNSKMEAPLAFQSAVAGILLASEVVLLKLGARNEQFPNSSQLYPLLKIKSSTNPYNTQLSRDSSQRCICYDKDFKLVYDKMWNS
ncbi:MAG: E2 ligase fold family C protein [Bacteroidetes bacterium]|nr:E2 ligase fold family C protein [Bacteroidota bacterium]